ncbi:MAG: hypothetical protein RIG84_01940 [Roseovarius sp.]
MILRLAALLLLLVAPLGLSAQENLTRVGKPEIMRFLAQLPDYAPIEQDLRRIGFRDENLALAVAHAESFYTDPVIAGHIADRLIGFYAGEPQPEMAKGLIWPLIERGLGHLPTNDLLVYYNVERAMIGAMPVHLCGRAVRNRLSPERFSDEITKVAARLHTPALREYYRVEVKAARLGARRPQVQLSRQQRARVETRVRAGLAELVDAHEQSGALRAAMRDIDSAPDARACEVGLLFYEAVMRLKGAERRAALVYMGLP